MDDCLFCKISAGDIPADRVFENDRIVAFRDINPQAPVHILIIPKIHIPTLNDLESRHTELVGELIQVAKDLARSCRPDRISHSSPFAGWTILYLATRIGFLIKTL